MSPTFNVTVDLTEQDVKQAIAEYVNRGFKGANVTAKNVVIEVGTQYEDRPGSGGYAAFKGAKVKVSTAPDDDWGR